jgi:hypothetical protein
MELMLTEPISIPTVTMTTPVEASHSDSITQPDETGAGLSSGDALPLCISSNTPMMRKIRELMNCIE